MSIDQELYPETQQSKTFDFKFIAYTLGLIPINNHAAVNAGEIADLRQDAKDDDWIVTLHNGSEYTIDPEGMVRLEQTLKNQIESNKTKQTEVIKNQLISQAEASLDGEVRAIQKEAMRDHAKIQMEIGAELQGGVQPGGMIVGAPQGKRFRQ